MPLDVRKCLRKIHELLQMINHDDGIEGDRIRAELEQFNIFVEE